MEAIKEDDIPRLIKTGNDEVVMKHIYSQVLPIVKRYVVKNSGTIDDAMDIFHDALMLYYEQVLTGVFDEKYKTYGYIYRISMFRWINKCKKDKKLVLVDVLPDLEQFPERTESTPQGLNVIKELFSKLGEKCAELLNYTIFTDVLMEDIMFKMGFSSVDAVRMQHMRCKQKMLKIVQDRPELIEKLRENGLN